MDRSPNSRTGIVSRLAKKIGIVIAGYRVDNGRDQVEQYPAFTFPITSVDILGTP
jgi:hypothetical protein